MSLDREIESIGRRSTILTKLLAHFPLSENAACSTAGVCGDRIIFNRQFMEQRTPDDREFILIHELYHILFDHIERLGSRDPRLWNVAADYNVNNTIEEDYIISPPADCLHGAYFGMTTEEIYDKLQKNGAEEARTLDDHSWWANKKKRESFSKALKQFAKDLSPLERAGLKEKLEHHGDRTQNSPLLVELESIKTHGLLSRIILNKSFRDVSWRSPNRKMYQQGVYLPSKQKEKVNLVVCVDTSGSTQGPLVSKFVSFVRALMRLNDVTGTLIQADVCIKSIQPLNRFDGKIHGGGGTSFVDALKKASDLRSDLTLYMTDLDGTFPERPCKNVIWAVPKGRWKAPFGRVVEAF